MTNLTAFHTHGQIWQGRPGLYQSEVKWGHVFLSPELRNEENPNVCVFLYDAVVFSSERDVEGRVLHKNQ